MRKVLPLLIFFLVIIAVPVIANEQAVLSEATKREVQFRRNRVAKAINSRFLEKARSRLERYNNFLGRVVSRRNALSQSGKDVTELDRFIATARTNYGITGDTISSAETALGKLDFAGNDVSELKDEIMAEYAKVKRSFTELHTSMAAVVAEIKAAALST
ncbi:hypothetical protein A2Z33_07410 [Candidatus Gottesmanbacteria bacterium RBG_16_52_11]|uniref:DUF5667 domain-containing protein n=1 Tax=Candidatus Gottesmanbacteria bacterium RBG_16_52_11 TaxID=1798374 RepID=A0A1F5YY04_9BACT|nr:MAG: hypothetical protein A2Z33_07410 [Candidatus Gottesmanbacteria bacterium RBG_16_52_11]